MHNHDDDHAYHHFDLKQPIDQSSEIFQLSTAGGNRGGTSPEVTGSLSTSGGGKIAVENISHAVVHEEGHLLAGEVYHDKDLFLENYKEMNKTFKIYIYPHSKTDPFANVFLPYNHGLPSGNYASESYFKIALSMSHFVTQDPSKADLFFMPFSIASMRHDKRIGVDGIKDFIKDYISSISHKYPFWNRTGGADHFYVACHSIGKTAMEKAPEVRVNAIQVVCSSSYFLQGYNAHKDASIPQIWPRLGVRPTHDPSKRCFKLIYR